MQYSDFPNRQSSRYPKWDYSARGVYIVTIVTHNRVRYFGSVSDGKMTCNEVGDMAKALWMSIPEMFPHVSLDAFVVMPDHLHGILHIYGSKNERPSHQTTHHRGGITKSANPMLSDGLPRIIRWFKGRFTHDVRAINPTFKWQPRYHDKIIFSPTQLDATRNYILQNPSRWNKT